MTFLKAITFVFIIASNYQAQSYLNNGGDSAYSEVFRPRRYTRQLSPNPTFYNKNMWTSIHQGELHSRMVNQKGEKIFSTGYLPILDPPAPVPTFPAFNQRSIDICSLTPRPFPTAYVSVNMPSISEQDLRVGVERSYQMMNWMKGKEQELKRQNLLVSDSRSSEYNHMMTFGTTASSLRASHSGRQHSLASQELRMRYQLTPVQASYGLQHFSASSLNIGESCPVSPQCGDRELLYRTSDGSCNNPLYGDWGRAMTGFKRVLPPTYADGISSPRISVTGAYLPPARYVSASVIPSISIPNRDFTIGLMTFGQFVTHDLMQTPIIMFEDGTGIQCCSEGGKFLDPSQQHPECLPMEIPGNDPFYSTFKRRCMNFVRSLPAPKPNCTLGFREQLNQVTHHLDASPVYGNSKEKESELRLYIGGQIRLRNDGLLPTSFEGCFLTASTGFPCLITGDGTRAHQQPMISALQTLWPREHNRIAKELYYRNPHWSDETLFQEARRIVIAELQHIVFNEWLPLVLGPKIVEDCSLALLKDGFSYNYDRYLDPTVRAEFSTVAFRFGHSLISGVISLKADYGKKTRNKLLRNHFNFPQLVSESITFNQMVKGFLSQPMESFDNAMTEDVTNFIFKERNEPFGFDLASFNIQRGRDHGVGTYADMREICGLGRPRTFQDLAEFIPYKIVEVFKRLYASVDDIDGFVAGISELPVNGGIVGPTFSCFIKDQFIRMKYADRFFYENGGMPSSFSHAQLNEIRKTSWAKIICDNIDTVSYAQPFAFLLPGPRNEPVPCDYIPGLNFAPWTANKG